MTALDEIERLRAALDEARAEVQREREYADADTQTAAGMAARALAAESALAAVRALADEWETIADRLSPSALTGGVRRNCADELRALLASSAPATASKGATEIWRDGRLIAPAISEAICVHHVGVTPGLWCGSCNTHPEHPDLATGVTSSEGDRGLSEVNDLARLLMAAWEKAEGRPANVSYVATFADMARAVLAARTAQPEEIEWGVQYEYGTMLQSGKGSARWNADQHNAVVVTRRPAGPWERVEEG